MHKLGEADREHKSHASVIMAADKHGRFIISWCFAFCPLQVISWKFSYPVFTCLLVFDVADIHTLDVHLHVLTIQLRLRRESLLMRLLSFFRSLSKKHNITVVSNRTGWMSIGFCCGYFGLLYAVVITIAGNHVTSSERRGNSYSGIGHFWPRPWLGVSRYHLIACCRALRILSPYAALQLPLLRGWWDRGCEVEIERRDGHKAHTALSLRIPRLATVRRLSY